MVGDASGAAAEVGDVADRAEKRKDRLCTILSGEAMMAFGIFGFRSCGYKPIWVRLAQIAASTA